VLVDGVAALLVEVDVADADEETDTDTTLLEGAEDSDFVEAGTEEGKEGDAELEAAADPEKELARARWCCWIESPGRAESTEIKRM
jgi:hypothetical protein